MSRIPRAKEHLKTGFTAEAVTAAHFRAYAQWAEGEGLPNLAAQWRRLAEQKDALAVRILQASEQVDGGLADVKSALAEERYENDVLYPKMVRDVDEETARILLDVIADQKDHLKELEDLRREVIASGSRDVKPPGEVQGAEPGA